MSEDVHSRYLRGIAFYDGHKLDTSDLDLPAYIDERIALPPPGTGGYLMLDENSPQRITKVWYGSQAEYDQVDPKVSTTEYRIIP